MALTSAMGSGISGLKAMMSALNVVGNNVANVGTYGYKAGRINFRESIYNTLTAGSEGNNGVGGINPSQVGFGTGVGTIDLDMGTQGLESTGRNLDCALAGDGFFVVGDNNKTPDGSLLLTRVGDFKIDNQGYLTDGAGKLVYGFSNANGTGNMEPIKVDIPYNSLKIAGNGEITYINKGNPKTAGYLAIAVVTNPNGLEKTEGPYYQQTKAAGDTEFDVARHEKGAAESTRVMSAFMEQSGTDLAQEFANMIVYQRGYQANTRIITVTDNMLEDLINIKR